MFCILPDFIPVFSFIFTVEMKITIFILLFLWASTGLITAQESRAFSENSGQWPENVLFRAPLQNGAVFLERNCLTFVFTESFQHVPESQDDIDNPRPQTGMRMQAYKLNFINTLSHSQIRGFELQSDYENYYLGNEPEKWASGVRRFSKVQYKDIYPFIDLNIKLYGQFLKYEFVVRPGGDPDDIRIEFEGDVDVEIKDRELQVSTSVNFIRELPVYAFQVSNADTIAIDCRYNLRKNKTLNYKTGKYNRNDTLVIDPFLVFSTYSGSTSDNWGFTATFDHLGNVYSGGIVSGPGYPVSPGAFQSSFDTLAIWDVGIIKYDSTGTQRLWASYLGGNGCEMPHSMVCNSVNDLIIFGTTGSSNFPVSLTAYDPEFSSGDSVVYANSIQFYHGTDIFVTRLTADGFNLVGSTYIGGTANDGLNFRKEYVPFLYNGNDSLYFNYGDGARGEVIVDTNDFIYVGTTTYSNDFPVNPTSFQSSPGGKQDGVLMKFSPDLSFLKWSSYLGGSENDAIYSVDVDENNYPYVAGGSSSSNLASSLNAYQDTTAGGSADGFVARIDKDGMAVERLSYFGTSAYDQAYFVRLNTYGDVFITGQTKSVDSSLVYNAAWSNPHSGQFIACLNHDLENLQWSTVFGSGDSLPDISITAFAVDVHEKIYLAGWGREWGNNWSTFTGIKEMETTTGAYNSVSDGQDFYLMILSDDGNCLRYATFFGEEHYIQCSASGRDHVDGGTSRFDKNGYIYESACASCGGCQQFPIAPYPTAWSTSNNSTNCNNAVFKFELESDVVLPEIHSCSGVEIPIGPVSIDTSAIYHWSPENLLSDPSSPNPLATVSDTTDFVLTLLRGACVDTIYQRVIPHSIEFDLPDSVDFCDYDSVLIKPALIEGQGNFSWYADAQLQNALPLDSLTGTWLSASSPGYVYLLAENAYCEFIDSVKVKVHYVSINALDESSICAGDTIQLDVINQYPNEQINYNWEPQEYIISGQNSGNPVVAINGPVEFIIQATNSFGCEDIDSIHVDLSAFSLWEGELIVPVSDSVYETQSIGIPLSGPSGISYAWNPDSIMIQPESNPAIALPLQSGWLYVEAYDQYNCFQNDSIYIEVVDVYCNHAFVYVPSGFSPNGDQKNDELRVYSEMVESMTLAIYNRWGEKLFETSDINEGWDGTYKGAPLPPGVFIYHLKASCWDGSYFEEHGNVTLIR